MYIFYSSFQKSVANSSSLKSVQQFRFFFPALFLTVEPRILTNTNDAYFQVGGIVDQLIKFGKVTRPILGIKFAPDQSVEQLGLSGVLVLDAPPNGPAGKAVRSFLCFLEFRKNST